MLATCLDAQQNNIDSYEMWLETIEVLLGDPGAAITSDQAKQTSQAVKAVAIAMGKQTKAMNLGLSVGSCTVSLLLPDTSCGLTTNFMRR